jgi:hypothetical protein
MSKAYILSGSPALLIPASVAFYVIDKRKNEKPKKTAVVPFVGNNGAGVCVFYRF